MTGESGGLNSQTRALLDLFESQNARPFEELGVLRSRRMVENAVGLQGDRVAVASVRDLLAEPVGAAGASAARIPIRLYQPDAGAQTRALILYIHGGGWVTGSVDGSDKPCRMIAAETGATVASVEYRRAPETPFPGALEDCYAALQWLVGQAGSLGFDPQRVVILGDSAGANLAAAVALLTRDRGGAALARQILLYPCLLPALDNPFDSYRDNATGYSLTAGSMEWFWDQYLGSDSDGRNPLAAPLAATELSRLPPATIVTAEFDPLRDEGNEYARRLSVAGIEVEHVQFAGTIHGFLSFAGYLDQAAELVALITRTLRNQFD